MRIFRASLLVIVAVSAALLCHTRARASTPARAIIANQATASFVLPGGADTTASNRVTTQVLATYQLVLSPTGTVATPAFDLVGTPSDTLVCRFTLDNLGNAPDSASVGFTLLAPSSFLNVPAIAFFDANGNGRLDPGEDNPAFLSLAPGTSTPLDVALVLPPSGAGSANVEVRVTSAVDPGRAQPPTLAPATAASVVRVTSTGAPPAVYLGPTGNPRALPGGEGSTDDLTNVAIGLYDESMALPCEVENAAGVDSIDVYLAGLATLPPGIVVACTDTSGTPIPPTARPGRFDLGTFAAGQTRKIRVVLSSPGRPLRAALGSMRTLMVGAQSQADTTITNLTSFHVDAPGLDPRAILSLDQTFREPTASLGDVATLVVTVTNRTDSVRVDRVRVVEATPPTLDFLGGGAGVSLDNGALAWEAGPLGPRESRSTTIKFAVNSRESKGWARAGATAIGEAATGDRAEAGPVVAAIRIDNEEFGIDGFVLGDVWVDSNGDGIRDPGERGVPGASVYLESGEQVVTDSTGAFSIPHVFEGRRVVRLDERSLPPSLTFAQPLGGRADAPRGNERLVHLIAPGHVRVEFPLREIPPEPVVRSVLVSAAEKVSIVPRVWLYGKLTLSSAQFAFGKANLITGALNQLTPAASFLSDNPGWQVLVEGNTDNVPIHTARFPSNQVLSEARADAVREALVGLGVSPERIVAVGYGDRRPVASNATIEGRELNRRVDVSFIPPGHEHEDVQQQVAAAVRDLSTMPDSARVSVFWSFSTTAERTQRGTLKIDLPDAFTGVTVSASMQGTPLARRDGAFVFDSFAREHPIDCRLTLTAAAADTARVHDITATLSVTDSSTVTVRQTPGRPAPEPRVAEIHPLDNPASARRTTSSDVLGWTEVTIAPRSPAPAPHPAPAVPDTLAASAVHDGPVRILDPADGTTVSNRDQVSVRVRHPLGSRVTLSVDGDAVSEEHVGLRSIDVAHQEETTTWYGVRLHPGWNTILAHAKLLRGGTASDSVGVGLASQPAEIVALDARPVVPADGRTPTTLRFAVRDGFGLPVMDGYVVTVTDGADHVTTPDARPGTAGLQVMTKDGQVALTVKPSAVTGTITVAVEADGMRAATDVVFVAPTRPFLATGLVDVTMGASAVHGSGSPAGVDNAKDGFDVQAESRLFVQGAAPGGFGVTARLDTKKRYDDPLLKQPDPEKQYPVFGDASELRYAAPARGGNYLSVDRGQSYLRYSDFRTPIDKGEFLTYQQAVTGLSTALVDGPNSVHGFVTKTNFVTRTDDIPANGTSGFYYLRSAPIVENSERIVVETRDRFQSEKVIKARVMVRRRDYTINPYDGSILFMQPVAATDRELNPNHISVTYETENAGASEYLFGMRADAAQGRAYRAGVTAVANSGDGPAYALYGADGDFRWRGLKLGGEVARSDGDGSGTGNAFKIGLAARHDQSKLDLYLRRVDGGFTNPSFRGADSELSSLKAGFDGRAVLSDRLSIDADGYSHELQRTDERRETARATLDYRRRLLEMSAGLRVARHDQPAATPSGSARDDARGVLGIAGLTVGNRGTFGVSTALEQHVGGDVVDDYPNRLKTVLAMPLAGRFRATATHEYLTASGQPTTHQFTAGIEGTMSDGAQVYTRYALDHVASEARMGAVSGIRQQLRLSPNTSVTGGVEGFASLSGRKDEQYVSVTTGISSHKPGKDFVDGGYEYRWEEQGDKHLLRFSAAEQLHGGLAWLTKNILGLMTRGARHDGTQYYLTLAGTYRSPSAPLQSLAMVKSYYDHYAPTDPDAIRWRLIASLDLNVMPDPRHELRLKYAYKHVEDWSYGISSVTNTDLALGQYVWHFGRGWDVDTWGRAVAIRGGGTAQLGGGVELGRLMFRSVRVAAGYSINGFQDPDVLGTDSWSDGFGIRIQMILSDWLLADFEGLK